MVYDRRRLAEFNMRLVFEEYYCTVIRRDKLPCIIDTLEEWDATLTQVARGKLPGDSGAFNPRQTTV